MLSRNLGNDDEVCYFEFEKSFEKIIVLNRDFSWTKEENEGSDGQDSNEDLPLHPHGPYG